MLLGELPIRPHSRRTRAVRQLLAFTSIASLGAAATACSVTGEANPAPAGPTTTASIRQIDDSGKRLPFDNRFPDRWSTNNNGTTYEPCTALTDDELAAVGIDPGSVIDVAMANGQTARGCRWEYRDVKLSGVTQATGNKPTFEQQMQDREWYATSYDIVIDGRPVMVDARARYTCMTTVKSGRAPVSTLVSRISDTPPSELCAQAIEFTTLTIPKMEPPAPE
ncbi:DUF3558 domain-containing protein [Gordonia pseudamarae]|uniref:DUF3558 domain-containing protein n=1 Tax=Gordonia pseudamarae TaxID=2831662 RepID=UPI001FE870F0|nr:DUF3558 domain-containing protein [Gordonia pseudamarae]